MLFNPVRFLAVFAVLLAGAANAAELSDKELAAGRKLYVTKCARCHKFYDPASYTDEQWTDWMDKMRKKARLSNEQHELLSRYLDLYRTPVTCPKAMCARNNMPRFAYLHFMLVHFPIALLVVASMIDWWQAWRKRVATGTTVLFVVGVTGAWLAVISGLLNRNWLLANHLLDTPELQTLSTRHQWLSIAAAAVFTVVLALKLWKKPVPSPAWAHALQVIGMTLLIAATHLGGLLAHGNG